MTTAEFVVLVDENDNPIGTTEKIAAHQNNQCHRAFSVFIFDKANTHKLLLQQRAKHKYHTPLLWTNTCCSHPRPNEDIISAGQRRLKEEMGISVALTAAGRFHYIAHFDNGLTENEVDHVLIGYHDQTNINFNPNEVEAYRWITISDLRAEITANPTQFTPWLGQALDIAEKSITTNGQ